MAVGGPLSGLHAFAGPSLYVDAEVSNQEARAQLIIVVCFLPAFMLLILIPVLLSIMQELFG